MVKQENAKVTIYDVAREAGVSKTSVSRYLGGDLMNSLTKPVRKSSWRSTKWSTAQTRWQEGSKAIRVI